MKYSKKMHGFDKTRVVTMGMIFSGNHERKGKRIVQKIVIIRNDSKK